MQMIIPSSSDHRKEPHCLCLAEGGAMEEAALTNTAKAPLGRQQDNHYYYCH